MAKELVEHHGGVTARQLADAGALADGVEVTIAGDGWQAVGVCEGDRITFTCEQAGQQRRAVVPFTWTASAVGGRKPWLLCPDCGRRVGVVYAIRGALTCRTCAGLAYRSQRTRRPKPCEPAAR